jgi:hypothetical protein
MNSLAHRLDRSAVVQELGTVVRLDPPSFVVRTEHGSYRALRATSCLVEPRADDLVLVAAAADGRCYVLAVLEREQGAGAELAVDGDLSIAARAGELRLGADDGVKIESGAEVEVTAAKIAVNALEGSVVVGALTYVGKLLQSEVEKVKTFAGSLDMVLDRFSQRVKRSYRSVEEIDQLRAAQVDYVSETTMSLHGKATLVTAERLVKVNGEQIHFG